MRILLLNYEYPPLGGGGGHVSHQLARELVKMGHKIDVLTISYKGCKKYEIVDGVKLYRVPSIRQKMDQGQVHEMLIYDLSALVFALRFIKKRNYDLCHAHFIIPTGVVALLIKKLTGLPYIITAHGSDVPGHNPIKFSTLHKFFIPLWKTIIKEAEVVISPSEHLKEKILANYSKCEVRVIPNGFSAENFHPKKKEKIILLVGRLLKFKGFQYFLEAIKGMDLKGYKVYIAGDGTYRPYLENIIKKMEPGKVKLLGWVKPDHLKKLYEKASIFVLPSEVESFGLVLLEAMAARCAVITTDIDSCKEIVGEAGIVVPRGDIEAIKKAIHKLIKNSEMIELLKEKGIQRVKNYYDWQEITKRYHTLFSEVIK